MIHTILDVAPFVFLAIAVFVLGVAFSRINTKANAIIAQRHAAEGTAEHATVGASTVAVTFHMACEILHAAHKAAWTPNMLTDTLAERDRSKYPLEGLVDLVVDGVPRTFCVYPTWESMSTSDTMVLVLVDSNASKISAETIAARISLRWWGPNVHHHDLDQQSIGMVTWRRENPYDDTITQHTPDDNTLDNLAVYSWFLFELLRGRVVDYLAYDAKTHELVLSLMRMYRIDDFTPETWYPFGFAEFKRSVEPWFGSLSA